MQQFNLRAVPDLGKLLLKKHFNKKILSISIQNANAVQKYAFKYKDVILIKIYFFLKHLYFKILPMSGAEGVKTRKDNCKIHATQSQKPLCIPPN